MDSAFLPSETMGVFLQVYNLKVDEKTHKADVSVQFRVLKDKEAEPLKKFDLTADQIPEHGEEMTLQNVVTLGSFGPGKYKLEVAVTDNLAKQTITPVSEFTVKAAASSAGPQGK